MVPLRNILLIDDEPDMLWVLKSVLRSKNFAVSTSLYYSQNIIIAEVLQGWILDNNDDD